MKKKEIIIYAFIWSPCLGYLIGWLRCLYYYTILKNRNFEESSIDRINGAITNAALNIFRIFDFNIFVLRNNNIYYHYHSNIISIILFFIGVLFFLIIYDSIGLYLKPKSKKINYKFYLLTSSFLILYFITYIELISSLIFEGFLLSLIIYLFYILNVFLVELHTKSITQSKIVSSL